MTPEPDSFYDGVSVEEDDEFAWFDGYDDDEEDENEFDDDDGLLLVRLPATPGAHTAAAHGLSDDEDDDDDDASEMADQGPGTVPESNASHRVKQGLLTMSQRAALGAWLDAFRKRWSSYWNYLDYTTMQV